MNPDLDYLDAVNLKYSRLVSARLAIRSEPALASEPGSLLASRLHISVAEPARPEMAPDPDLDAVASRPALSPMRTLF
jgi:hypothetical protein